MRDQGGIESSPCVLVYLKTEVPPQGPHFFLVARMGRLTMPIAQQKMFPDELECAMCARGQKIAPTYSSSVHLLGQYRLSEDPMGGYHIR